MGRIGSIKHEKYDPAKVAQIYRIIEIGAKTGQKRDYEMLLDGFKVVSRTADPEVFNSFQEFVSEESECLIIFIYYGASQHYDSYYFYFKDVPPEKNKNQAIPTLNGIEQEKQQREKILKELQYEKLEQENQELKSQFEELEEKLVSQQADIDKAKSGKVDSYSDIGVAILMKFLSMPVIQKKFPGIKSIFGELSGASEESQSQHEESQATFRRKGESASSEGKDNSEENCDNNGKDQQTATFERISEETETVELSESDLAAIQLDKILLQTLGAEKYQIVIKMVVSLIRNPHAVRRTAKYLQNFIKTKPQQEPKKAA